MASASSRPRLRLVETVVVPDRRYGRAVMLRDTHGVATSHTMVALDLWPLLTRFDGTRTCDEIARDASAELGERVPVALVVKLATELEEALFLDGPPYRRARARVEREFAAAAVRAPSHAGGAYHDEPRKLADYIERECFAAAPNGHVDAPGAMSALIAPHIDPWRGARCYGAAYGRLARRIPRDADTFVIFGTSHAPMRQPFALCRKTFATPLGALETDHEAVDTLAKASAFDPYGDQFNHKREHSLEFQVVFLRHLLGARPARIIPILAGLGEQQTSGRSPSGSAPVDRFLSTVAELVERRRAIVIAGADLAHVGPRFGDPRPLRADERERLHASDRGSLDHAAAGDAESFWHDVAKDLDTRRVCGLAPIYALLRTMRRSSRAEIAHYEQTIDPEEGSIVSHAAVGYFTH